MIPSPVSKTCAHHPPTPTSGKAAAPASARTWTYLVALAGDGVLAYLVSFHHHLDAAELVVLEDVAVHLEGGQVLVC